MLSSLPLSHSPPSFVKSLAALAVSGADRPLHLRELPNPSPLADFLARKKAGLGFKIWAALADGRSEEPKVAWRREDLLLLDRGCGMVNVTFRSWTREG